MEQKTENLSKEIIVMQNHLKELRRLAGWTSEELGLKLGMTKQAVSALENGNTKLNQVHYLALLYLFELKITEDTKNTEALKKVMELLFSDPDYYEENKIQIDSGVSNLASAISGGVTGVGLAILISNLLIPVPIISGAAGVITGIAVWSKKILSIGKKNKK